MRTLYIECNMGAAGDMLTAALYELLDEGQKREFLDTMNSLGLPGVKVRAEEASTCGIAGTHMSVTINGEEEEAAGGEHGHAHEHGHEHAAPGHIAELIGRMDRLPAEVREAARGVYGRIAQAEAKAHGCPAGDVHFHEVGALDAVADVTGACYALFLLRPERILVSPVHVGSGTVRCAHGVMPVPAPATANLLEGVPVYGGAVKGELCTPTGAALLTYFADGFGEMPVMVTERTGVGIGARKFEQANCVRIFLGETPGARSEAGSGASEAVGRGSEAGEQGPNGTITELVCNMDDMTPEALAFAAARLLEAGALDVYTVAGTMKKGRSGHILTVLARPEEADRLARCILRETTTNGVKARRCEKYYLRPGSETVRTHWGEARVKTAEGYGVTHAKPEYEDAAKLARAAGISYREAAEEIMRQRGKKE